jgi:UDP-2-acetamido-3-amino-2,3-dideoxy-glucuronate N-acetyltransferase
MAYFRHPSAIIDEGARIGDGSKVWHFSHICSRAKIGNSVSLGQNVFVGNDVIIGDGCKIQNNVSVFDKVILEADVFCGPNMVFTNVYNPRASVSRKDEYRQTTVKRGATIGANATILCGLTIGEFAFIGAGAVVLKDVKPYSLVMGVPAEQKGWVTEFGEKLPVKVGGSGKFKCLNEGKLYLIRPDGVVVETRDFNAGTDA